jgi:arsenate reductase
VPDPSLAEGSEPDRPLAFADTMRRLSQPVSIFMSLPFRSLNQMSLQNRVREIGRLELNREKA